MSGPEKPRKPEPPTRADIIRAYAEAGDLVVTICVTHEGVTRNVVVQIHEYDFLTDPDLYSVEATATVKGILDD